MVMRWWQKDFLVIGDWVIDDNGDDDGRSCGQDLEIGWWNKNERIVWESSKMPCWRFRKGCPSWRHHQVMVKWRPRSDMMRMTFLRDGQDGKGTGFAKWQFWYFLNIFFPAPRFKISLCHHGGPTKTNNKSSGTPPTKQLVKPNKFIKNSFCLYSIVIYIFPAPHKILLFFENWKNTI